MLERLEQCKLCPHKCNVNRLRGKIGKCKATDKVKISLVSLHHFEEPCISGTKGSGTIFFSNCNFNCVFCQNYKISQEGMGEEVSVDFLANSMLNLQNKGAHNINLVTPVMYVYHIIEAIKTAKSKGLKIPIIYNSNGYENIETLQLLKGYIDVYLPDFKYSNNNLGKKYSNVNNYFEVTTQAIKEMYNQVGPPKLNENGIIQKGLIIRHLILPNENQNTKNVLKWIRENIDDEVYISIMTQYFPTYKAKEIKELSRKINIKEYEDIEDYIYEIGIENGYMQDLGEHEEEYVPEFKNSLT